MLTSVLALGAAGCGDLPERRVLRGASPLVAAMNDAAAEHDVPAEILAGLAWAETGLRPPRAIEDHDDHAPRSIGVMGLPEVGAVRSAERAARLLGVPVEALEDERTNVRAAAVLLRALADELFGRGVLGQSGSRDRWLIVAERYFDAGAAGEALALDVRRTIARGLSTTDSRGAAFEIPSFAELYTQQQLFDRTRHGLTPDYPNATWVAADASNYTAASRTAADIDVVVIHTVQGSYAGAISWFRNPSSNVTAHYVIRRSDGAITQMVQHKDVAWHAGNSTYNRRSIGIEHEGWVADANNYTPAMLRASADLTRWLCDNLGIPKDRSHIIAHSEVPGATHTDPGQHFPWTQYMDLVRNGMSAPPPTGNGTLQGVIYIGTDNTRRLAGATVTISPGGQSVTSRAGDGYWSFSVAPGAYTVTARANGYDPSNVTRTVAAGGQTWGSMGLTASVVQNGTLKGLVYDGRQPNTNTRIAGATVRLSTGQEAVSTATGLFEFTVPAGEYSYTVSKAGWQTATNQRTVVAGQDVWGSTGIIPEAAMPSNRAPQAPAQQSPVAGVTTRTPAPVFTVDQIRDPDGDALSIEIEIYRDRELGTRVSAGTIRVPSGAELVTWNHPAADLPRGTQLFWRVRANDGTDTSPWSEPAEFWTYDDASALEPSTGTWTAEALPGVGTNEAPGAPEVQDPADESTVTVARPQIVAKEAADPEGDALVYQFQVAGDDLFETIEAGSELVTPESAAPGWVIDRDLAPGGRYYVRVRAADDRVFSPWSAAVSFILSPDATSNGEERPSLPQDRGGKPEITVLMEPADGCSATGASGGALWPVLALAVGLFLSRRRR